ncbi:A disintegrin and metalloproteinase with thrombospondin motifs 6-like [Physella acuta]|uniref:A disintegrin and metalloproteinase with thrombospondin motifs 6-like n=1 Tax=Physella acuta TaxID=109671 RepID=UPI0027DDDA67|nr:A disintegrin and metalloproteinase with thrombospondin motifs 6-like [Physella acuta]
MIQRHWVSTHFKLWILTCITGLLLTGSKGQVTEWGSWSGYTECSRTCGSGVQVRSRVCLVRRQVDGACQGDNTQARSCNTEPCPAGTVDFRTAQCSSFNGVPIKVNDVTKEFSWRPYFDASRPCALVCRSNKGDVMTLRETVADGTSCDHIDTMGVCVGGVCKNIGCDRVLGSTVNEDNCLVCGGQDKKCHTEEGSTLNVDFTNGEWKEVVTFPLEATRLAITILSTPPSALELRSDDGQSIELTQLMSGSSKAAVEFAGTRFIYHTEEDESKFTARGPINQTLYLKLLFNRQNPLVQYRYSIPRSRYIEADAQDRYAWLHGSWSLCSANCGVGFQLRAVRCIDRVTGQYVNQTLCPSDEVPISNQTCNNGPCYISVEDRFKFILELEIYNLI